MQKALRMRCSINKGDFELKKRLFVIILAVALVLSGIIFGAFYTDYMEIREIGREYTSVFFTDIFARVEMGIGLFILIFVLALINLFMVRRNIVRIKGEAPFYLKRKFIALESVALAVFGAVTFSEGLYRKFLLFLNRVDFGVTDPIFNFDLSYYFFTRDFLQSGAQAVMGILTVSLVINIALYFTIIAKGIFQNVRQTVSDGGVFVHIAINVIAMCVLRGFMYFFDAQGVLLKQGGVAPGPGFVETNIMLPFYTAAPYILLAVSIVGAIFLFLKKFKGAVITILIFPVLLVLVNTGAFLVQALYVEPNEATLEKEYIENSIKYTKIGFGLDKMVERTFPAEESLTRESLQKNSDIINNIRITDPTATKEVLNSTKSIRSYYTFNDTDIVEYTVDSKPRAVSIAARELDVNKLSGNANNYINKTMKYTHGYGIVMNPVNAVNSEGQPEFIISDMPIASQVGAPVVTEPRIYYGEKTNNYVIVNTDIKEFDYASNNENIEKNYEGTKSGIKLNLINRLIYSIKNMDYTMLISGYINSDSRLLTNRNIMERVKMAVPFMTLDPDPYIIIDGEGRLKWVVDLYTHSDQMPYSKLTGSVSYIRNSAKAVVDAYEGEVKVYITDTSDPIVMTYSEIYPSVFANGLPEDISSHIRYPEFLFSLQSEVYLKYHMSDAEIFYTNSDLWMKAKEKYYTDSVVDVQPYYNLLSVEDFGRDGAQLVLMMPFVPANKENLVSWLAADSYGNLISYKFPSGRTVYGTLHIENRIDSDAEISKELSLWDQGGSEVLRGNVLVVPIENSLIYVEPVYITTTNEAAVPEVKRIIVAYGDKVVMRETLEECFSVLFGEGNSEFTQDEIEESFNNASDVVKAYDNLQQAFKNGNWQAFAFAMEDLGKAVDNVR